jgi:transposase-like protein
VRCPELPDRDPIEFLSGRERDRVPGNRKGYAPEFKEDATKKVVDDSLPITQVARELRAIDTTLDFWVKAYKNKFAQAAIPERWPS